MIPTAPSGAISVELDHFGADSMLRVAGIQGVPYQQLEMPGHDGLSGICWKVIGDEDFSSVSCPDISKRASKLWKVVWCHGDSDRTGADRRSQTRICR